MARARGDQLELLVERNDAPASRKRWPRAPLRPVLAAITDPGLLWAVPVTLDNAGNVYTADYENGNGSDLHKFDSSGKLLLARDPWSAFHSLVVTKTSERGTPLRRMASPTSGSLA